MIPYYVISCTEPRRCPPTAFTSLRQKTCRCNSFRFCIYKTSHPQLLWNVHLRKLPGWGAILPKSERRLLGQSIPAFNPFLFILFRTLWSQRLTRNPFAICRLRTLCHSMGGGGYESVWQLGCTGAAPLRPPRKSSKISAAL